MHVGRKILILTLNVKMAMSRCADEKKFIIHFIENYQCLQALWNTKSAAYSNRDEKKKEYELLLNIYKEQYPNATIDDVKKKIYVLRTSYQREKQKLEKSTRSGAGAEEQDEPSLFYFNEMRFLDDVDKPCKSRSSLNNSMEDIDAKTRKRKEDPTDTLLELAVKRFAPKEKSNSKIIAESWAIQLDEMEPTQRILCQKFIGDIIFEGRMGTLHRNSLKICPNNNRMSYFSPVCNTSTSSTPVSSKSTPFTPITIIENELISANYSPVYNRSNSSTHSNGVNKTTTPGTLVTIIENEAVSPVSPISNFFSSFGDE